MRCFSGILLAAGVLCAAPVFAETYTMTEDDDWSILESAEAGDVVEIAPGTYQFRVFLENAGTARAHRHPRPGPGRPPGVGSGG